MVHEVSNVYSRGWQAVENQVKLNSQQSGWFTKLCSLFPFLKNTNLNNSYSKKEAADLLCKEFMHIKLDFPGADWKDFKIACKVAMEKSTVFQNRTDKNIENVLKKAEQMFKDLARNAKDLSRQMEPDPSKSEVVNPWHEVSSEFLEGVLDKDHFVPEWESSLPVQVSLVQNSCGEGVEEKPVLMHHEPLLIQPQPVLMPKQPMQYMVQLEPGVEQPILLPEEPEPGVVPVASLAPEDV